MVFCDSFEQVPRRILLDIDDTEDRVHGGQQLALFNTHYDSRCFLPIHIYEAPTGKPVAVILRPGKTPDGTEVALVLRHVIGRIRARWPAVEIVMRGDSHYGRPKAMAWCERQQVGYIFGLSGNPVLLFELISQRYERGATLITSNPPFDEWTETFGSERLTGALLDRLTHHVSILNERRQLSPRPGPCP